MINWKFRPKQDGEVKTDPIHDRFFTTSDVGNITVALVRESIQNSLDARKDKKNDPAQVRFYLNNEGIKNETCNEFFKGLEEHLFAQKSGLLNETIPDINSKIPYLVVEDYYTTGLEGNPLLDDDPENSDSKENFYWFWRNIARSNKGADDIGRWGVGKTVFPASSEINSFFGVTVRQSDDKKLLMGHSVLKYHQVTGDANWYCPYGYFAKFDKDKPYFAKPFNEEEDSELINSFEQKFNLERTSKEDNGNYYGLSVVIPFPRKEVTKTGIIKAVIQHYFYPIIEGKLIVEVGSDNDNNIEINKETIIKVLDLIEFDEYSYEKRSLSKLFHLTKNSITFKEDNYIKFLSPPEENTSKWKDTWLRDENINNLLLNSIDKFENGEIIAFKIPLRIQEIHKEAKVYWYKAFIQYDGYIKETESYFIRDGITITGNKTIRNKSIRVLIILEDKNLAMMFGDSENPAHTEFQKDSPHLVNKYLNGAECISFMINTVSNLYKMLLRPPEGTDDEILKDIFYIEKEESSVGKNEKITEDQGENPDINSTDTINGKQHSLKLKRIVGGFKITKNPKANLTNEVFKLNIAYMVPRGNPLKKYSPLDFDLDSPSFKISSEGVDIINCNQNIIKFIPQNSDFFIEIIGFDVERDLFIKV
jgi:hypothetical protein